MFYIFVLDRSCDSFFPKIEVEKQKLYCKEKEMYRKMMANGGKETT